MIKVTVDKGNYVPRPLYNVQFRMKPKSVPSKAPWELADFSPDSTRAPRAGASVRRARVQQLGLRHRLRWGPLSQEGRGLR